MLLHIPFFAYQGYINSDYEGLRHGVFFDALLVSFLPDLGFPYERVLVSWMWTRNPYRNLFPHSFKGKAPWVLPVERRR